MDFSIVIPTWNRSHLVDALLKSLFEERNRYDDGRTEVIVVDSSTGEEKESIVSSCKQYDARYIDGDDSVRKKRNKGIRESQYDYILFIDSDVVVEKGLLNEYVDAYKKNNFVRLGGVLGYTEFVGKKTFWWKILELGSIHLREKMDRCKTNMIFIRGEEVHAAKCPVHILSLGANKAIAPQVTEITDEQKQILLDLVDLYSGKVDEKVDIRAFVAAMDVFNKIKDAGGVSVLCHIYWDAVDTMHHNRMGAPEQLINALVNECKFDAFEITSGAPESDLKANYLQEIYYREKLPMNFPIIGITDSHTTLEAMTIFGKNYTIAFTDDRSEMGVLNALRQGLTVSVDGVGSNVICHGSLRLVKYASFLRERFYQRHDELARLEALLMERVLNENYDYISLVETVCDDNNMLMNEEWKVIM